MNGSVSVTKKGRLWATWLGGEDGPEGFVIGAKSDDAGKTIGKNNFGGVRVFRSVTAAE